MDDPDELKRHIAQLEDRCAELEKSKRRFDHVLEVARIGTWDLDLTTRRATWSPETRRILGVGPDIPGSPETVKGVTEPDDRSIVEEALRRVAAGSRRYDVTYRVNWPDGTQRVIHSRGNVILDGEAKAQRIAGVVQDVTEQEGLRAQLLRAQKTEMVGRLAAGLAHDLNNMLTVIQGSCAFVRERAGDEESREEVSIIVEATERAADLTRGLLAFSRQQVLRPVPTDLNQLVGDLRHMLSRLLGEDILLELQLGAASAVGLVDPHQLVQVIVNLALNARHAMAQGGRLVVRTARAPLPPEARGPETAEHPYLLIAVQDTGIGMDAATLARIFEPFFTTRGPHEGTGLGLSSAFGVVAQSGGHLRATSTPGVGSTFEIYLPELHGQHGQAVADAPAPAEPSRRTAGVVLVVEDDAAVRRMTVRVLSGEGCTVLEAENGQDALTRHGADTRIEVLLTDVMMPGLSGRELADAFLARMPRLQVLFMSGYAGDPRLELRGPRPTDAFLAKPFTPAQLARRVLQLLGGAPAASGSHPPSR